MAEPNALTKTRLTVAELEEEDLYGVLKQARGEAGPLPPAVIYGKLRAAEDFYERDLQTFFGLKRIASEPESRGIPSADYDLAEPAYDLQPDAFIENAWGRVDLNYRAVKRVTRFFYSFPGMNFRPAVEIPAGWIRLNGREGVVNIVPMEGATNTVLLQMGSLSFSLFSAGRLIPQMVFVDYEAGIPDEDLRRKHADLLEGVKLRAVLMLMGILSIVRTGGLGNRSLSEDGLSQSEGFGQGKYGPYSPRIELALDQEKEIRRTWRDAEHGPIVLVA